MKTWRLTRALNGSEVVAYINPPLLAADVAVIELEPVLDLLERMHDEAVQAEVPRFEKAARLLKSHGRLP